MSQATRIVTGLLAAPGFALPEWAQGRLHLAVWDRSQGPERPILHGPVSGPEGAFRLELRPEDLPRLAAAASGGHGPQHLATVGWGASLNPALAHLLWPEEWAERDWLNLGWQGQVTLVGYVEQMHLQEVGGLHLAILELVGHAAPPSYRRLPPLPLPPAGDRHGPGDDRSPGGAPDQVYYLLAEVESPLAAAAQDALVSNLRVVCLAGLGAQEAYWHEVVNVPLVLEALTLVAL